MTRHELEKVFRNADLDGAKKRAQAKLQGERDWKNGNPTCPFRRVDLKREWRLGFRSAAEFHIRRMGKMERVLESALSFVRQCHGEGDDRREVTRAMEERISKVLGH